MNRKFLAAVFIAISLLAPQAQASVSMTLNQYVREILLNNPSLQANIKSVEAEYYSVLASVGTQRPQLSASAGTGWTSGSKTMNVKVSDIIPARVGMTLTHRIDISGQYSLTERQGVLGYEIARAQFDNALNTLIASTEQAWWATVLARENLHLQEEVLRQRSENHRVTLEKYRQELVPRLDVVRSDAQVVEAESLVKQAETAYQNRLAELSRLAGGLDVVPVEEPLQVPSFDVEVDYEEALRLRPDVRGAKLTVDRAKVVKKLRAKGLSPTLDFGFQWTAWSDPDTSSTPQNREMAASLTLNLPILDGNRTKYNILNTDRLVQSAEASLQSLHEQTRYDLAVAMNNWKNAEAGEIDKKRQVERAEEELRITELMYTEGMGAQIDLLDAQTNYLTVNVAYLTAVRDMYLALVDLRKAMGDYAPDEDGTWREAISRYGKGNPVVGEVGLKVLRREQGR